MKKMKMEEENMRNWAIVSIDSWFQLQFAYGRKIYIYAWRGVGLVGGGGCGVWGVEFCIQKKKIDDGTYGKIL